MGPQAASTKQASSIGFVALCASGPAHRKAVPARGKLPFCEASKQASKNNNNNNNDNDHNGESQTGIEHNNPQKVNMAPAAMKERTELPRQTSFNVAEELDGADAGKRKRDSVSACT